MSSVLFWVTDLGIVGSFGAWPTCSRIDPIPLLSVCLRFHQIATLAMAIHLPSSQRALLRVTGMKYGSLQNVEKQWPGSGIDPFYVLLPVDPPFRARGAIIKGASARLHYTVLLCCLFKTRPLGGVFEEWRLLLWSTYIVGNHLRCADNHRDNDLSTPVFCFPQVSGHSQENSSKPDKQSKNQSNACKSQSSLAVTAVAKPLAQAVCVA